MRKILLIILAIVIITPIIADVAPSPIVVKGIYTNDSCKIQMIKEYVYADIYGDSAKVECIFELKNHGDSVNIEIGFPEMNFQYLKWNLYNLDDKSHFQIIVDDKVLTNKDIKVPAEMKSLYQHYMDTYYYDAEYNRKFDSLRKAFNIKGFKVSYGEPYDSKSDSLYKWWSKKRKQGEEFYRIIRNHVIQDNFPWYVWDVTFDKGETKIIKVIYKLPAGKEYGLGKRFFNYILRTGRGWYDVIESADILLQFHNVVMDSISDISPDGFSINKDSSTIKWRIVDFEPNINDDIFLRYINIDEIIMMQDVEYIKPRK